MVVLAHLGDLFPNAPAVAAELGHFSPVTGLPVVPWTGILKFLAGQQVAIATVGVLLFFLVSGFVIPFSLQHRDLRAFFVRRFFRLYPTLAVCLLVTVTTLAVQAILLDTAFPFDNQVMAGNALLISPYVRQPWIEPVLWTLAVEELFYVIAATLSWRGLLTRRSTVLLVAGGLTVTALSTGHVASFSPLFWLGLNATFVILILIGVVFHQLYHHRWGPLESAALLGVVFAAYLLSLHKGPLASQATVYTKSSVVALIVFGGLFLARDHLPYSRLLDRLSNISYPLYLLHAVNGYVMIRGVYVLTGNYYVALVSAVAASVALATIIHIVVETPTNDLGRRLGNKLRSGRREQVVASAADAGVAQHSTAATDAGLVAVTDATANSGVEYLDPIEPRL